MLVFDEHPTVALRLRQFSTAAVFSLQLQAQNFRTAPPPARRIFAPLIPVTDFRLALPASLPIRRIRNLDNSR